MDSTLALREFLEYVITQLIEHPEEASIAHRMDGNRHVFEVELAEGDVGKVIGKNGQTVGAIRNLLEAGAWRNREKVVLRVHRKGEVDQRGD
jgi:predicted RNA-binding protein YlqC (UPF0109 family)